MMEIRQCTEASQQSIEDLNDLLVELRNGETSGGKITELESIVKDPNTSLVIAEDEGRILGMGMVYVLQKVGKKKAFIEDVVVSEAARGKGLGTQIMQKLITFAHEKGAEAVVLTSNLDRKAAHAMYEKLGFEKRETNVYRMKF